MKARMRRDRTVHPPTVPPMIAPSGGDDDEGCGRNVGVELGVGVT